MNMKITSILFVFLYLTDIGFANSGAKPKYDPVNNTLVYTCNILFPNDSAVFRQDRVEECVKNINPEFITYIHVVATASTSGTSEYNLELSNTRSKVVKDLLQKIFPHVGEIHDFGGGQNPRFGRQARIFIVVQPREESTEIKEEKPIVIRETEIKKELILAQRSKHELEMVNLLGISTVSDSTYHHKFLSLGLRKSFTIQDNPYRQWIIGGYISQHQASYKQDFQEIHGELGARFLVNLESWKDSYLFYTVSGLFGLSSNKNDYSLDFGLRNEVGVKHQGIGLSLEYTYSYQVSQLGLGVSVEF